MQVQQRLYDIDDLWRLVCDADDDKRYELIEGEIFDMAPPGGEHGYYAFEIGFFIRLFDRQRKLGVAMVETGFHPPNDRYTVLSPDFSFTRKERAPNPIPKNFMPLMPDLAVEIKSPSNTLAELRRKAAIYLNHGSQLVWIILPASQSAEVHRLDASGDLQREIIAADGALSGEQVLPGFALPLAKLFA